MSELSSLTPLCRNSCYVVEYGTELGEAFKKIADEIDTSSDGSSAIQEAAMPYCTHVLKQNLTSHQALVKELAIDDSSDRARTSSQGLDLSAQKHLQVVKVASSTSGRLDFTNDEDRAMVNPKRRKNRARLLRLTHRAQTPTLPVFNKSPIIDLTGDDMEEDGTPAQIIDLTNEE